MKIENTDLSMKLEEIMESLKLKIEKLEERIAPWISIGAGVAVGVGVVVTGGGDGSCTGSCGCSCS